MNDENEDDVVLIRVGDEGGPGLTEHRRRREGNAIARNFDDLKTDWEALITKIAGLADAAEERGSEGGLRLSELTVELGFTASGRLAFIAEAGATASITLKFSRE